MTAPGPARLERVEQPTRLGRVERFERVPAEFARYAVGLDGAARLLGLSPQQTSELACQTLPHETDPERGPLFDYVDVMNLALFAGTSRDSIPELALRFLLRFASGARPSWYEPRHWLVRVRAPRTEQDPASADLRLLRPDLTAPGVEEIDPRDLPVATTSAAKASVEPPGYEVAVRLTGAEATVGEPEVRAVYDDLLDALRSGTVIYQSVSEELRMLHERAWDLGMADCVVVSRLLAQRLREAGYQARARRGYLLGLVGSDHSWCEYFEDGHWKTLDLVFAFLAGGAGQRRIQASPEFAAACRGGRFNRLLPCEADEASALILSGGEPAPPWALAGVSAHPWES